MKGEMKKERIKGGDILKNEKKTQNGRGGGVGNKKTSKKNQKKGFHKMAIEFNNLDQICFTLSDGNQNGFDHHHSMMNKMDLITTIKFGHRCWMETKKGGIWENSLSTCFGCPQGWETFKNMVAIQSSQILRWQPKFFSC